jgi:CHAT domain-containing protein
MIQASALAQRLGRLAVEHRRRSVQQLPQEDLVPDALELLALAHEAGIPDIVAAVKNRYAAILLDLRRYDEAESVLHDARAVLKDARQHDLGVSVLARLAELYGRQERWSEADRVCAEGIEQVEQVRYRISAAYMQSGYLRFRMALYSWGVRAAFALGNHDLMLERAELSKGRATLRTLGSRSQAPESEHEIQQRFQRVCSRIDEARSRGDVPAGLLAERRTLWDLLSIQRYRAMTGEDLPAFDLVRVRGLLAEDETVLYYYFVDRLTLLIVTLDRHEIRPQLRTLTEAERVQLDTDADWILRYTRAPRDPARFDLICKTWHRLVPVDEIGDGARRLTISPHGPLHALPFHAMPDAWDPLIRRFAVSYVPNLGSLLFSTPPVEQPRLLALGIRDYELPGRPVAPLPNAEKEALAVAEQYRVAGVPTTCYIGAQAREAKLHELDRTGELRRFSCLHLATHGTNVPGDAPLESYLYARDSLVDGLEIAGWQLNAELVVLSACCSGQRPVRGRGMDSVPGDELFGLQAAFFTAGCACIISALWPVGDATAPPIMEALHRHLLAGDPPEVALQRATLEFLEREKGRARRIESWAPFFVVRIGRATTSPEPTR